MKTTPTRPILLALALAAVALPSFAATAMKISSVENSVFYRGGSGTRGNAGTNGGHGTDKYFDGDFDTASYQNTAKAYLVVETTKTGSDDGYFVTDIIIGNAGKTFYSLWYTTEPAPASIGSDDNRTWLPVDGAANPSVKVAGVKTYGVYTVATAVKYVWETTDGWTPTLCEIEVRGIDTDEMTCLHPNLKTATWSTVQNSATCTQYGYDERVCPDCQEAFHRENPALAPIGHDYVHTVTKLGTVSSFGSGEISCSRCDFKFDCAKPLNAITTRDANGKLICGIQAEGIIRFINVYVSSTGNTDWGQRPDFLIDGNFALDDEWGNYWYGAQAGSGLDYVQFAFDTTIDLAKVELSVPNRNHSVVFYSYDVDTDTETEIQRLDIEKDDDYEHSMVKKTVYFFGDAASSGYGLKVLRVRSANDGGNTFKLGDIHPYFTARGAGRFGQGDPMFLLMQ